MLQARQLVQPYRKAAVISVQGTGGLTFVGGRGAQIQYALVGPDLAKLDQYTAKGTAAMDKSPLLVDVDRSLPAGAARAAHRHRPQARRRPRRPHPGRLADGQRARSPGRRSRRSTPPAISTRSSSRRRTRSGGRPSRLPSATVRTASGELVQLRNLVSFNEGSGPAQIDRLNRQRQITISANPAPGISQAEGQAALEAAFASLDMEPGYNLVTSGQSRELGRAAYYFAHRVRAVVRLHVYGARGAVRVVHPPGHDPADAAAGRAVRPRGARSSSASSSTSTRRSASCCSSASSRRTRSCRSITRSACARRDCRATRRSSRRTATACGRS